MGRTLIDHHIQISRDDRITRRGGALQIGSVRPFRSAWIASCEDCTEQVIGRTRTTAANDMWDHWTATHAD